MDKMQQEVYDRIILHLEYKKSTKVMPIHILHHEILQFMRDEKGWTAEGVNTTLNALYAAGFISVGKTVNYTYITLPQYIEQVNGKIGNHGTTQEK